MDNAFVLRNVAYASSAHSGGLMTTLLTVGDVLLGDDGTVVDVAPPGRTGLKAIQEIDCDGQFVLLPALRNAYVHAAESPVERCLKAGVTEVHVQGGAADAHAGVTVVPVDTRPSDVVCVRDDAAAGRALPDDIGARRLGSGSMALDLWADLQAALLLQLQRQPGAPVAINATESGRWVIEAGMRADLILMHVDALPASVGHLLLRASSSDVCGVFVRSRLVHRLQPVGERLRTVNPRVQVNGHIANSSGCEFDSIEEAVAAIAAGKFVVVVDNEDRENEGDLIIAAEFMTPEKMAFMVRFCSGLVCIAALPSRLEELQLPLMVTSNNESFKTAFTISVDYMHGTTTGISAADRAATARAFADPRSKAEDFARPGHMFPLRYAQGGTLTRMGHTEASVDLCKLANVTPCGVLCEIALDDGSMARRDYLRAFARHHGFKIITIADLIRHRRTHNLNL